MRWKITMLHLKTMLTHTPFQFLLILLTQIFAAVCILLSYGISQNIFQKQEEEIQFHNRWFEVSLTDWEEQADGSWKPLHPMTITELNAMLSNFLPHIEDELSYFFVDGNVTIAGTRYSISGTDLPNAADETSQSKISYSEYENGNPVVVVSYQQYPCKVGDVITIGGREYEVVDTDEESVIGSYINTFSMPYRSFPEDTAITTVSFVLNDVPTSERAKELAALMQAYFGIETQVAMPIIPDLAEQQFNRLAVLICVVISLLVIMNVSLVYLYTLRQRKQVLGIYGLCGCTPEEALCIFACEWILLLSICYGSAVLLFRSLLLPQICRILEKLDSFYSSEVYLSIYGLYLLFSVGLLILGCSPMLRRHTAVQIKEGG